MHNDNTTLVLACLCVHLLSLFSSSVFAFSFQGLAHLKAEQGTLSSVALYFFPSFFCFTHWFWGICTARFDKLSVSICVLWWFPCCCGIAGWFVCLYLLCCVWRMHEDDACSSFRIHPPHASVSLRPCFMQTFLALHNCVGGLFLQLRCGDTLHCSCLTFVASGKGKLGWQGWKWKK